jgi:hypothetical protein
MIDLMDSKRVADKRGGTKPHALAFYLPQFHPIPENDEWWGPGFTEWNNVTRARPSFPGHYQPHVPGELGYYDLRVPEIREAQAALAAAYGVSGFVYYHYWFHGRRLLERPFDEVLASGSPDFPFALCWANEEWSRNWDGTGQLLIPQEFSDEDDLAHIRWLANAFADDRYITIDGRPLMLIYRPKLLPNAKRTAEIWRTEAQRLGFPDIYLCWVESWGPPRGGPEAYGMDAAVGFMPLARDRVYEPYEGTRGHRILDYQSAFEATLKRAAPKWKRFPSVMVGWDNSARRPQGATIFTGSTPEAYERWLRLTADSVSEVRAEENYLFIVAWNEWAEGNHLEPDQRYGRAYLEATKAVLLDPPPGSDPVSGSPSEGEPTPGGVAKAPAGTVDTPGPVDHESALAHAAGLLRHLNLGGHDTVVDLGGGAGAIRPTLVQSGLSYLALGVHPGAGGHTDEGAPPPGDLSAFDTVRPLLDEVAPVGALCLLDVIEHLDRPHELLASLSEWSLKHGEPTLVVSVPNVAHFDMGLRLLCGHWDLSEGGLWDPATVRFFTASTLQRMFERCGWTVVARDDFVNLRTDQYDAVLNDGLPVEMVGALRTLSATYNPQASVEQFVWALAPFPVSTPPATFLEAVGGSGDPVAAVEDGIRPTDNRALHDYLEALGLVSSETNRRAARQMQSSVKWRVRMGAIKKVGESPHLASAMKKVHGWLR